MPPFLALSLCAAGVAWLFRRDLRERPNVTPALWLPVIWFSINCSRTIAQWLVLFGGGALAGGGSYEGGTPIDAVCNFAMLCIGVTILKRRHVRLNEVIHFNRWLALFFLFCLVAISWSDLPFVSFKRWIKILGHPIMALIILTEPDPEEALTRFLKRCAYLVVPFSIVFIKYFPGWGRGFDEWSGLPSNTGVTTNKNILGCVCFIFALFFAWQWLKNWPRRKEPAGRRELILCAGFLIALGWLLHMAHSSTSSVSLAVGLAVMIVLRFQFLNSRNLGVIVITAGILFIIANQTFGITDSLIATLGKDPTLTDRTKIWHEVLKFDINPVIGAGFEGFWSPERRERMTEIFFWEPNQAHNGYLETYLNLGLIGLGLMIACIIAAFRKNARLMETNLSLARFRLGFLAAFVLYNWTEAAFKELHPVWTVFFLTLMDFPSPMPATVDSDVLTADRKAPASQVIA